jgi:beta-1,4-mannosyltransferase
VNPALPIVGTIFGALSAAALLRRAYFTTRTTHHPDQAEDRTRLSRADVTVAYIPWYPTNPYQIRLRDELAAMGVRVHSGVLSLRTLRALVRGRGPAIAHIHWPHGTYMDQYARYPFVIFHLLLYRLIRNNVIWTVHELEFYETRYPLLDRFMVRFLMVICRQLIVHSDYSAKLVRERYCFKREIVTLRHPSFIECYPNDIAPVDARARLGLATTTTAYLFLGHIKPYKGVESLIETFKRIDARDTALMIVGQPFDAETAARIRSMAADDPRIRLVLTYVPDEDLQIYMQASDVVVFPFRQMHTSGSVLLAMSFGKPVVAPALAAIPEYVDDRCAVLFDPTDTDGLRKSLVRVSSLDLRRMGKAAFDRAVQSGWKEFANQHAAVYQSSARGLLSSASIGN